MYEKRVFLKNSIFLLLLMIASQIAIYFKQDIVSFIPFLNEGVIFLFGATISVATARFFYVQSERNNEEKNMFIEVATHKFRTPISVIEWSSDSLETGIDIVQRREEVKKIRNSLEKMKEIIDSLVGVIQAKSSVFYHFNPVNFRTIFESALRENLKRDMEVKGIKLNLNIPGNLPTIFADNRRLEFVIKSLIENSITYTKPGGEIMISAETLKDKIIFSVRDTGIGISEKDIPNIFSDFYRTKEAKKIDTEGMGLGLYVSREIIEKHGGKIWVESSGLGKGATFFIELKIDKYKQVV